MAPWASFGSILLLPWLMEGLGTLISEISNGRLGIQNALEEVLVVLCISNSNQRAICCFDSWLNSGSSCQTRQKM